MSGIHTRLHQFTSVNFPEKSISTKHKSVYLTSSVILAMVVGDLKGHQRKLNVHLYHPGEISNTYLLDTTATIWSGAANINTL